MEEVLLTRAEHEEFCKRMDEAGKRRDKRLEKCEAAVERLGELTASVGKLATNMEHMLEEQKKQGDRLEALEGRDGELWRTAVKYAVTAVVGAFLGVLLARMGLG